MKTMARKFFALSFVYLLGTVIWVLIFVEEPIPFMERNAIRSSFFIESLTSSGYNLPLIGAIIVMSRLYHGWRCVGWAQIFGTVLLSLVGVAIFMAAFASFKTTISMVLPFYADGYFAEMDRWLLLGQDAWVVVHRVFPQLGPSVVDIIYGRIWIPVVFLFPLILFLFDNNRERVSRYIILYFIGFFIVGDILALIFLSVGPVYFDTYYGTDTFAGLKDALEVSGVSASHIGKVQAVLGEYFLESDGARISDIAAFPSVHVSAIMVSAIYANERNRILGAIMAAFVAAIVFMSVYTGYHWLVDGLASILIMIVANFWLKKSRLTKRLSA